LVITAGLQLFGEEPELTEDMIRGSCQQSGSVTPSLLDWLITPAYAALGDCTVRGRSGEYYTIPAGLEEDCISNIRQAKKDPEVILASAEAMGGVAVCVGGGCQAAAAAAPEVGAAVIACVSNPVCAAVAAVVVIGGVAYIWYETKSGSVETVPLESRIPPIPGAIPAGETKGRTTVWDKGGGSGMADADKDFDDLVPGGVVPIDTEYGQGRRGVLPDGRTVVVRPGSTDGGRPTLEIQDGKNRIKIRY